MAQFLTAKEQVLDKVFSNDYVFSIPVYQRPYSWGVDQARELLDDLLSALDEAPAALTDAVPYFLGSAVLIKSERAPQSEVVDGQQRLTTLTILLSALRHVSTVPELKNEVTRYIYEKGSLATNAPDRYRLTLRPRDTDFFRKFVQREQGLQELLASTSAFSEVERRIRDNARIFCERLATCSEAELLRLYQFLMQCCVLVLVSTPDLDSAYRIFGVMNSRGLDLSATDVLKAEIIGGLPETLRNGYTAKWEDQEELMGRERFNELFSHIRTVYLKAKSQATLLKDFRENVPALRDAIKHSPQVLLDEVILPMAEDFEQIVQSTFSTTRNVDAINQHLSWLNKLEFQDWVPPVLAFLARHRNEPDQVLAFLADMERLAYSMLLRREDVNQRIRRFARITKAIEGGVQDVWTDHLLSDANSNAQHNNGKLAQLKALYEAGDLAGIEGFQVGSNTYGKRLHRLAKQAAKALRSNTPLLAEPPLALTDEEKAQTLEVLQGELYGKLPTRVLTVVLKRLDQLLSNQNATYSGDASIEHVLPQNPGEQSEWQQWIPDEQTRAHWVHRLGNLVLLSRHKNSEAQNYDFGVKKSKYFASRTGVVNFALTTQVTAHAVWNEQTLQARQNELVALFAKSWRLD